MPCTDANAANAHNTRTLEDRPHTASAKPHRGEIFVGVETSQ